MYGKEKVNNKQKRLFDTSFVQNGKEKATHFIFHPDKNKRPFLFAVLVDVFRPNTEFVAKISVKADNIGKNKRA